MERAVDETYPDTSRALCVAVGTTCLFPILLFLTFAVTKLFIVPGLHSWAYPEAAWSKIAGVPLYSGFMYASVACYLCQTWRRLQVILSGWPC